MAVSWGNAETISERPENQPTTTAGVSAAPGNAARATRAPGQARAGKPPGDQGGNA